MGTYIKPALAMAIVAATAMPALAISRVNTTGQSCAAVQERVWSEGAVILRYPAKFTPGLTLYGRYVASARFCNGGEITERAYVPAADTNSCRVLKCVIPDYDDDFFKIRPRLQRD